MNIKDKKFWENYWYYYKIHTFAGIFALVLIITTLYQCATTVNPDFTALYIGSPPVMTDKIEAVQTALANAVGDLNKDGKKTAVLSNISASLNAKSDMDMAGIQKADIEIMAGDAHLIFTNDEFLKRYVAMDAFADITEQAKKAGIDEALLIKDKDGKGYVAVDISSLPFAQKMGMTNAKVYMSLRVVQQDKKNDKAYMEQHNKSAELFDKILNGSF